MNYFLQTDHVGLNPLEPHHIGMRYAAWLNDAEITSGLETGAMPATVSDLQQYVQQEKAKGNLLLGIFDTAEDRHVGNIKLGNINWIARHAELGLFIGEKSVWGKGFGLAACKLVIDHAFHGLNLEKVWLAVFSDNDAAIRLYKKLGFSEEGRLKNHVFKNGEYQDKILMAVYRRS